MIIQGYKLYTLARRTDVEMTKTFTTGFIHNTTIFLTEEEANVLRITVKSTEKEIYFDRVICATKC